MAELLPGNPDFELMSNAINWWLTQEVIESDFGRNAYLSEFNKRRGDFYIPYDEDLNYMFQKAKSHHNRLVTWIRQYSEDELWRDDWHTAKLTFAPLMQISGSYRKQCYLEADGPQDYLRRRLLAGPTGINVHSAVAEEIEDPTTVAMISTDPADRLARITERTLDVNDQNVVLQRAIHEWAAQRILPSDGPIASPDDEPVVAMIKSQKLLTGLLVAHIAVAASFRDFNYAKVPFLEPKSISDVSKVIYPLAV